MATFGDDMILGGGQGGERETPFLDKMRGLFDQGPNRFEEARDRVAAQEPSHKGPFQNVDQIGREYSQRLLERLQIPTEQSESFFYGSKAIRDALTGEAQTARQRLGDTATAGGFLDSGAVIEGSLDIARGKSMAMSQAVNDLFLQLEDRRERDVLPFLSAFAGASLEKRGQDVAKRGQEFGLAGDIFGGIGSKIVGGFFP